MRALSVLLALLALLVACRRSERQQPALGTQPVAVAPLPPRQHPPLPENAEAGLKATAQWQEHEAEEEENRKLCFDRAHLPQHRALTASLQRIRQRYERAKSKSEAASARAFAEQQSAGLKAQLDEIDPWQNSSLLVADYAAMLELLTQRYPSAQLAAFRGAPAELRKLQGELERDSQGIQRKLAETEECEQE